MADKLKPSTAPGRLIWTHADSRGLSGGVEAARSRAASLDWQGDGARADLRALLVGGFGAAAAIGSTPPAMIEGELMIVPQQKSDRSDFVQAQKELLIGLTLLMSGGGKVDPSKAPAITPGKIVQVKTEDGGAMALDAGIAWAGAVAVVGVTAVIGAVVWQYFSQTNELEYTRIATDANVQKHAQAISATTQMVESHLAREDKAGQSLPWDEQELNVLKSLMASSGKLADWTPPPPKSIPDTDAVTKSAGKAIEDVGAGVRSGTSLALPLLAVGAAWWAFS